MLGESHTEGERNRFFGYTRGPYDVKLSIERFSSWTDVNLDFERMSRGAVVSGSRGNVGFGILTRPVPLGSPVVQDRIHTKANTSSAEEKDS